MALTLAMAGGCASASRTERGGNAPAAPKRGGKSAFPPDASVAAQAHYGAGVIHEMNGNWDAALEEYSKAAALDPADEHLVLGVSQRFLQNKKPEKALELLQRAATHPDASAELLAQLGMLHSQLGQQEEARRASQAAIRQSPTTLSGYQVLFLVQLQTKQLDAALQTLEEAARQKEVDAEFLVGLTELCFNFALQAPSRRTNVTGLAVSLLKRAEALPGLAPALQLKMADGYSFLGETERAAQLYLEVLQRLPDVPLVREHVHAKLAEIYLRGSDHERALEQLEALVREDPTNAQAYFLLGTLAQEARQAKKAADYFRKTVLLRPDFEPAYYEWASAQLGADQAAGALATLAQARARFAPNFLLELLSGLACAQQKAYGQALQHYAAAEVIANATDPRRLNHVFYLQVGAAHERKGDYQMAEKYFEKCLSLKPDYAEAQNYLGYMWAERGTNLVRARELLEQAVKTEPNNAAYLDSLAWVLFKLNEPAAALDQILKAVEHLEQPDATVYDHLGDIQAALGRMDQAREAWRKALEVEPSEAIRKKLESHSPPQEGSETAP